MPKPTPAASEETLFQQLSMIHQFFPRIDAKATFLFGIVSAQIAFAATKLSAATLSIWWVSIPLALFAVMAMIVVLMVYRCAFPDLKGGHNSLIYFAEISKRTESSFCDAILSIESEELREEIATQIWRNSEIVAEKFRHLKAAMIAIMLGLVPWAAFIAATAFASPTSHAYSTPAPHVVQEDRAKL